MFVVSQLTPKVKKVMARREEATAKRDVPRVFTRSVSVHLLVDYAEFLTNMNLAGNGFSLKFGGNLLADETQQYLLLKMDRDKNWRKGCRFLIVGSDHDADVCLFRDSCRHRSELILQSDAHFLLHPGQYEHTLTVAFEVSQLLSQIEEGDEEHVN